jgi:WhiB family redox-sensing transcriptional regulator
MTQGACRSFDPVLFDTDRPPPGDRLAVVAARRRRRMAKRVCHDGCPVLTDCLRYALTHGENYGIWGGTSPEDREGILRSPRRRGQLARILAGGGPA